MRAGTFWCRYRGVNSWEELNAYLLEQCRQHRQHRVRGQEETIGERFERDRAALLPLPPVPYEACEKLTTKVNSYSLVRYRTNDYSVPTRYGYREVLVKGYVHEVVIACGSEVIARHPRSYEHEDIVFEPLHYLALLEQKPRALDQAAPLAGWQLPECFAQLRRLLEARLKQGRQARVYAGLAFAGDLPARGGHARGRRRPAAGHHQLRCGASICCCAASSGVRRGWTWRTIRTCRWRASGPRRPPITWLCWSGGRRMSGARADARTPTRRHATGAAGTSPEAIAVAHLPSRVRQGGAAVRRRKGRLSPLSVAHD